VKRAATEVLHVPVPTYGTGSERMKVYIGYRATNLLLASIFRRDCFIEVDGAEKLDPVPIVPGGM
jgi:hypothetical protein